jgi:hypothetical protein
MTIECRSLDEALEDLLADFDEVSAGEKVRALAKQLREVRNHLRHARPGLRYVVVDLEPDEGE